MASRASSRRSSPHRTEGSAPSASSHSTQGGYRTPLPSLSSGQGSPAMLAGDGSVRRSSLVGSAPQGVSGSPFAESPTFQHPGHDDLAVREVSSRLGSLSLGAPAGVPLHHPDHSTSRAPDGQFLSAIPEYVDNSDSRRDSYYYGRILRQQQSASHSSGRASVPPVLPSVTGGDFPSRPHSSAPVLLSPVDSIHGRGEDNVLVSQGDSIPAVSCNFSNVTVRGGRYTNRHPDLRRPASFYSSPSPSFGHLCTNGGGGDHSSSAIPQSTPTRLRPLPDVSEELCRPRSSVPGGGARPGSPARACADQTRASDVHTWRESVASVPPTELYHPPSSASFDFPTGRPLPPPPSTVYPRAGSVPTLSSSFYVDNREATGGLRGDLETTRDVQPQVAPQFGFEPPLTTEDPAPPYARPPSYHTRAPSAGPPRPPSIRPVSSTSSIGANYRRVDHSNLVVQHPQPARPFFLPMHHATPVLHHEPPPSRPTSGHLSTAPPTPHGVHGTRMGYEGEGMDWGVPVGWDGVSSRASSHHGEWGRESRPPSRATIYHDAPEQWAPAHPPPTHVPSTPSSSLSTLTTEGRGRGGYGGPYGGGYGGPPAPPPPGGYGGPPPPPPPGGFYGGGYGGPPAPPPPPPHGGYYPQYPPAHPVAVHAPAPSTLKDVPLLTGPENHLSWAEKIKAELKNQGVWRWVKSDTGTDDDDWLPGDDPVQMPLPITRNSHPQVIAETQAWYAKDECARHIILSRISPSILPDLPKREEDREARDATARTLWDHIAKTYGRGGKGVVLTSWGAAKVLEAKTTAEVRPWLKKFEAAYNRMVEIGQKPPVLDVLHAASNALPVDGLWGPIVERWSEMVDTDSTGSITATAIFQKVNQTLNHYGVSATAAKTPSSQPTKSSKKSNTSSASNPSAGSGGAKPKPKCSHCSRNHNSAECWAPGGPLHGDETGIQAVLERKRRAKEAKASGGVAAATLAPPTQARIEEVAEQGAGGSTLAGVCFAGIPQYDCHDAYVPRVNPDPPELACTTMSERPAWLPDHLDQLLDSGCSKHIFRDKRAFWDYQPVERASMTTANCGALDVLGKGVIRLLVKREDGTPFLITLKDCRHAPAAALNLISVGTWQKNGIAVNFTPRGTTCVIEEKCVAFAAHEFETLSFACGEIIYPGQEGVVIAALLGTKAPSPLTWHYRLGHLGMDDTRKALSGRWASGVTHSGTWPTTVCSACMIGKGARKALAAPRNRATRALELLHVDICGPFNVFSTSGQYPRRYKYWIGILDDWSNYLHVQPLVDRLGAGIVEVFDEVIVRWERRTGKKVAKVRFDGALELTAGDMREYLVKQLGIDTQKTAPHNHWQNGKAERVVRTIEDSATALLAGTNLPRSHWLEATLVAQFTRNRSPTSTLPDGITPYERMFGQKPDLSLLRVFGSKGYAWIPPERRKKGDNRREEVIMVGYERGRKGWWCLTPSGRRMFCADVHWEENVMGRLSKGISSGETEIVGGATSAVPAVRRSQRIAALHEASASRVSEKSVASVCLYLHLDPGITAMVSLEEAEAVLGDPLDYHDADLWTNDAGDLAGEAVFLVTRADRKHYMRPREFNLDRPPASQWEAYQRKDAPRWIGGEKAEVANLWERGVFEKCELPHGARALPVHFVYAQKADGTAKCRLVADGNRQRKEDVGRTSSPVAMASSIRNVLAEAATEDLELKSADVKTAFLWATMSQGGKAVYVKQIPKHPDPDGPQVVYRLKRPLYGLQEAAFEFYEHFKGILASLGMNPCPLDRAVFFGVWDKSPDPGTVPMPKGGKPLKLVLPIHVDDCLGATNSVHLWDWWIREMNRHMEVKDLGDVEVYLGQRIVRERSTRRLWISMTDYIDQILADEGLSDCIPATVPLSHNINHLPDPEPGALPEATDAKQLKTKYQRMNGCVNWLAGHGRPDIAYASMSLGQHASNPQRKHLLAAKQVYRYLSGTRDYVLQFPAPLIQSDNAAAAGQKVRLESCGLTDADWANDESNRRSVSGFAFFRHNCLVSWRAVKQKAIACSSMEAELYAFCNGVKEAMWMKMLLKSLWFSCPDPFPIFTDNQSTLSMIDADNVSSRTKHIDVRYHFIRDQVHALKNFVTGWIPSKENTADIFTKPLSAPLFQHHRTALGVIPYPSS